MDNKQNGEGTNPLVTQPRKTGWSGFIRYIKSKLHEREAKKKAKSPADKAARITAMATVWIAVFTVVLGLVGTITLIEVILGGTDTHELAVQAKNQADKMKDMSDAADRIQQAAHDMVMQEQRIADNAKEALKASSKESKAALDASTESARQDRRPWVGIRDFRCEDCTAKLNESKPDQPFSRMETLRIGNMFGVMENTGKTPAIQMAVHAVWTNRKGSDPIPDYDAVAQKLESAYQVPSHVSPEMASEIANTLELIKRYRGDAITVLPPNAVRVLPMVGGLQMERDRMARIEDENVAYVVGKIIYYSTDRAREYVTTFCLMNEIGSDFRFCPTGNNMK